MINLPLMNLLKKNQWNYYQELFVARTRKEGIENRIIVFFNENRKEI